MNKIFRETIDLVKMEDEQLAEKKKNKNLRRKFRPYELQYQENKPKKPVSSFFIFYQDKLKELGPKAGEGASGPKISQIVAEAWNALSDEQKRPYIEKANETKRKYVEDMRLYIEEHADQIEEARTEKKLALDKQKSKYGPHFTLLPKA